MDRNNKIPSPEPAAAGFAAFPVENYHFDIKFQVVWTRSTEGLSRRAVIGGPVGANGTRLSFFGGVAEVGGNKLLLESKGSRIFLDFGMSFKVNGRYFSEFLKPRNGNGLTDYWRMGLLPRFQGDEGAYRADALRRSGVRASKEPTLDAVLITHAHMDHVSYVHFLRPDIPVHIPSEGLEILTSYEATAKQGNNEFLTYYPSYEVVDGKEGPKRGTVRELGSQPRAVERLAYRPFTVGEFTATAYPVDHSLPGAAAYVVETRDSRLCYTGDIRLHGRRGSSSERFIEKASEQDVDVLLVEGTRLRDPKKVDERSGEREVSEATVEQELREHIASCDGLVIANWPARDLDRLVSFESAAKACGRTLVVDLKQAHLLRHLESVGAEAPRLGRDVKVFVPRTGWCSWNDPAIPRNVQRLDYAPWERDFIEATYALTPADLRERPRDFVWRCDFFSLHDMVDVEPPPGSIYIHSLTEPFNEEMRLDQQQIQNWLDHFGMGPMRKTHASGHMNADQLADLIRKLRPKVVYPVHTEYPVEFEKIVERAGVPSRVVLPRAPSMEEAMKGDGYFPLP